MSIYQVGDVRGKHHKGTTDLDQGPGPFSQRKYLRLGCDVAWGAPSTASGCRQAGSRDVRELQVIRNVGVKLPASGEKKKSAHTQQSSQTELPVISYTRDPLSDSLWII